MSKRAKSFAASPGGAYRLAMESISLPRSLQAGPYLLRLPEPGDEAAVVAVCQDPEIARWTTVPSPYGPDEFLQYLEISAAGWGTRSGMHVLAFEGDRLVASVAASTLDWDGATAEIGYYAAPAARRSGSTTAVVAALCDWLFATGFVRLQAEVLVGNVASARLLTRLGFVHEGTMASVAAGNCGDGSDRVDIELWARIAEG